MPVTDLATLTDLVQGIATRIGAGTLILGKHFRQEGDSFVFSFAGHAPVVSDEEDPGEAFYTFSSEDPVR
ncbi:hypothetical protein ABZ687_29275 [Streptomyces ardesiacus]|uniref:hypothetical protein n=1 Tax=Streptomyces ardesiacus TaxID=285564 RepID=UPI0033E5CE1D